MVAAVLCGAAVGAMLPAAGGAETAGELESRADALRAENDSLAASSQTTLAGLTLLEGRLARARAELASFRERSARVRVQRRAVRQELHVARTSLRAAQRALASRLQTLYEEGHTDVLGAILESGSLDQALTMVEALDLAAEQDERLVRTAHSASARLTTLSRSLAGRQRELDQLAAVAAAATESLEDARAERLRALVALKASRESNLGEIASLNRRARTLASVAAPSAPTAVPGAPSLPSGPASSGVRSLTVVATAYALPGTTATGRPVGWGVVAVDPGVIPLGSRLAIPGYGMGVAADTGGAIKGAKIDVWFPTVAQAHAWGSRTVTITVYPN